MSLLPYPGLELLPAMPSQVGSSSEVVALVRTAYAAHHETVRAFARRLVGDAAAAEDLVQETFVALPRAAARANVTEPPRELLLGICANHAKHHVRAAARRRAAMARFEASTEQAEASGPESQAMRAELRQALQRALDALSLEHRVVVVLCEVEERSAVEVARILDIPEATVRTRLWNARRKLRAAFGEEGT